MSEPVTPVGAASPATASGRLRGRTALVTGAASGIGQQVATRFVAEGARVVFADRNGDGATAAAEEAARAGSVSGSVSGGAASGGAVSGGAAMGVTMDITDEGSVRAAFAAAAEAGYEIDTVVANAGVQLFGQDAMIADVELEVFRATVDVNLIGTFLTLKHAVRALLERPLREVDEFGAGIRGSIIVTGSPTGLTGEGKDFTAYSSTKAGGHGLARAVAAGYADQGIRVNIVVPGYTETPLVTSISGNAADRAAIVSRTPLGRPGRPADVEGIMVYLASDESSYATGGLFKVDGGMTSL